MTLGRIVDAANDIDDVHAIRADKDLSAAFSQCEAVVAAVTARDLAALTVAACEVRKCSRRGRARMLPVLRVSTIIHVMMGLFVDLPDVDVRRVVLQTLMVITNACKDARSIITRGDFLAKVAECVTSKPCPDWKTMASGITLCAAVYELGSDEVYEAIRETLSFSRIDAIVDRIMEYECKKEGMRLNSLVGVLWLTRNYCKRGCWNRDDVQSLLNIFTKCYSYTFIERDYGKYRKYDENFRRQVMALMVDMLQTKVLEQNHFEDSMKPFVAEQMKVGDRWAREFACQAWCVALESEYDCGGLDLGLPYELVLDICPEVRHEARRLVHMILKVHQPWKEACDMFMEKYTALIIQNREWSGEYDQRVGCALCFATVFQHSEADVNFLLLANSGVTRIALDCLLLEEQDHIDSGLAILQCVCMFVTREIRKGLDADGMVECRRIAEAIDDAGLDDITSDLIQSEKIDPALIKTILALIDEIRGACGY